MTALQTVGRGRSVSAPTLQFSSKAAQEESAIRKAADNLLSSLPTALLLYPHSAVPVEERLATRRDAMLAYDAGTIIKAQSTLRLWLAFCERHSLPDYGAPFDEETCLWFLREEDHRARARASGSRSGTTVKNSLACSLRWLSSSLLIPFHAESQPVRKAARVHRAIEPAWACMWPTGVLQHLLYVALRPSPPQRPFLRAYAAGAYLMCAASLRQIDGLRSAPPQLISVGGNACFHAIASLTKGRSRAHMQPLPWWVPTASPLLEFSDAHVAHGICEALNLLPPGSASLFPALLDSHGNERSLAKAVRWGTSPAAPRRLSASLADIFQGPPLSLSPAEACKIGGRRHGPRHTLPEVARVAGMAAAAREEIGRWKSSKGRLNALSNRYSREGERVLQCQLRAQLLRWIAQRAGSDLHAELEVFVATQAEFDAATSASLQAVRSSATTDNDHSRPGQSSLQIQLA